MASRTGRAFDFEIVAVVVVEFLERLNEKIIDRQPDRPAPIRIAAENIRLRFAGVVTHDTLRAVLLVENIGISRVEFADRAYSMIAQEFSGIQHPTQEAFHAMSARERNQAAIAGARLVPARNEVGEVGPILQIPFEALLESRHRV